MNSWTEIIDYHRWALEQWRPVVPRFQDAERAEKVYNHILRCFAAWLPLLLEGHDRSMTPHSLDADLDVVFGHLHRASQTDLGRQVPFWKEGEIKAEAVLHHMLNHQTYHLGHLRGLAETEGLTDFPDTDRVYFEASRRSDSDSNP